MIFGLNSEIKICNSSPRVTSPKGKRKKVNPKQTMHVSFIDNLSTTRDTYWELVPQTGHCMYPPYHGKNEP
jgi:hypothetical protein